MYNIYNRSSSPDEQVLVLIVIQQESSSHNYSDDLIDPSLPYRSFGGYILYIDYNRMTSRNYIRENTVYIYIIYSRWFIYSLSGASPSSVYLLRNANKNSPQHIPQNVMADIYAAADDDLRHYNLCRSGRTIYIYMVYHFSPYCKWCSL